MGDKISVISEKAYTFEGIFNLKETYLFLKDYIENNMCYDVTEKEYEEKNTPPSYKIVSNLEIEKYLNDNFHIVIKGKLTLSGKDVEVEINGIKKKMVQGVGNIVLNSYIVPQGDVDPETSPFASFLNQIYDKFVGNDETEQAMVQSAMDVGEIIDRFKQHMNSMTK